MRGWRGRTATLAVVLVVLVWSCATVCAKGNISKRLPPDEYGTLVLNNFSEKAGVRPVVFRHWVHRARHTCRLCHVDIGFAMAAGETRMTEEDNRAGKYCGVCHNGKEAFGWESERFGDNENPNCDRCHAKATLGRDPVNQRHFEKLRQTLPEGRFGNEIDWAAASRLKKVMPRDYIEGVSFDRPKLKHDQGNLNLDAKLVGLPDISFSHKEHAVWNSCELCHPDLFALKVGTSDYSMQEIFAGQYCGVCHGTVAFPLQDCGRCHAQNR